MVKTIQNRCCESRKSAVKRSTDHRGKIFFFVCVRFRLMGVAVGMASMCCELLGNDDDHADRLDLSLDGQSFHERINAVNMSLTIELLPSLFQYSCLELDTSPRHHSRFLRLRWHAIMLDWWVTPTRTNLNREDDQVR